jgi:hypothetical protein
MQCCWSGLGQSQNVVPACNVIAPAKTLLQRLSNYVVPSKSCCFWSRQTVLAKSLQRVDTPNNASCNAFTMLVPSLSKIVPTLPCHGKTKREQARARCRNRNDECDAAVCLPSGCLPEDVRGRCYDPPHANAKSPAEAPLVDHPRPGEQHQNKTHCDGKWEKTHCISFGASPMLQSKTMLRILRHES